MPSQRHAPQPLQTPAMAAFRQPSPWRLPDTPPRADWTRSAWFTGVLGLLALGLLLAFCKVVSNGVQRGEHLRSQFASVAPACEDLNLADRRLACRDQADLPLTEARQAKAAHPTTGAWLIAKRQ